MAPAVTESGQWLYRSELAGSSGDVTLRLTLRSVSSTEFDLGAADALGQPAWRLTVLGETALFVDFANRRFCRRGANETIALAGLRAPITSGELAALLRGDFPDVPAAPGEGAVAEWSDGAGRSVSGRAAAGRWSSWTLRLDDRPRLWYRFDGTEALLSGREPAFQLRWRETARGPLAPGQHPVIEPPAGFAEGNCFDGADS